MAAKLNKIIQLIESLAPKDYAMKWDNVGLQIGCIDDDIHKIMVCLDVTKEVVEEAISQNINLIITHHPIIFSPLKAVLKDKGKGELIYRIIQNNINIYAAHTNIDIAPNGLNDYVAKKIGLNSIDILEVLETDKFYKTVVFVPEDYEDKVADALAQAGAGHIGNYSHCTFRTKGIGTFKPLESSNPFIGQKGQIEKVREVRLETIVSQNMLKQAITNMIAAHPYEEVAYDLIPLSNLGNKRGIGRVGKLKETKSLKEVVLEIKSIFKSKGVRVIGNLESKIENIAIVNGSGADYIELAKNKGCDCLITGDIKYHEAQYALELGLPVIDLGHYETEIGFLDLITDYLEEKFKYLNIGVEIKKFNSQLNPFKIL